MELNKADWEKILEDAKNMLKQTEMSMAVFKGTIFQAKQELKKFHENGTNKEKSK